MLNVGGGDAYRVDRRRIQKAADRPSRPIEPGSGATTTEYATMPLLVSIAYMTPLPKSTEPTPLELAFPVPAAVAMAERVVIRTGAAGSEMSYRLTVGVF